MTLDPWYQQAFGAHYLQVYAHRSTTQAFEELNSLLSFLPELDRADSILDLCCGGGRHLVALASLGFQHLVGVDLSEDLLTFAKTQAKSSQFVLADMRNLPFLPAQFACIFQFFTSFGYFSEEENKAFLAQIYSLLRPKGFYLLDYLNPEQVVSQLIPFSTTLRKNFFLQEERQIRHSRVEKKVLIEIPSQKIEYTESVRLYSRKELEQLLLNVGFSSLKIFGSFDGKPYDQHSSRMIVLAIRS